MLKLFFLFAIITVSQIHAANVLFYIPTFGQSHVNFLYNIADILAGDGHNVTILYVVVDTSIKMPDGKASNITVIPYTSPNYSPTFMNDLEMQSERFWLNEVPPLKVSNWNTFWMLQTMVDLFIRDIITDTALMQKLNASNFDLAVVEPLGYTMFGLFELLNIKHYVSCGSIGVLPIQTDAIGVPTMPSFVPSWDSSYSERMTFMERVDNFKEKLLMSFLLWRARVHAQNLIDEFAPGKVSIENMMVNKTGVIFANVNEFTTPVIPATQLVQFIGGAHIRQTKPLTEEFDTLLNKRKGAILFSFGTIASACTMPKAMKLEFLEAFAAFPEYTFLWKYEKCPNETVDFSLYPNVVTKTFLPQSDLLADPRLKFFITHCGMNSFIESTVRGKPMLAIPLFGDQLTNAKTAALRGLAVIVDRNDITKEKLVENIEKLLKENSFYQQNALRAAEILKGKTEAAKNNIKLWVNNLMKFGRMDHMFTEAVHLNTFQLYSLDCIAFLLIQFLGCILFCVGVLRLLTRFSGFVLTGKQKSD